LDELADDLGVEFSKTKFGGKVAEAKIAGEKVVLLKPETFMNESGRSLREAADFYKVSPEDLLVIYDDFDIPVGTVRIRPFGSAGTHNGMRSVISCLGTQKFPRIRLGTGSGDLRKEEIIGFVLAGFDKEDLEKVEEAVKTAKDAAKCYVEKGIDMAMNRYNTKKENNEK
jgi:PTH1 family peptidyl-tRNA hydrolase